LSNETYVEQCPELTKLAKVALTITVSTSTAERGFSLLRLIMPRLRNRLSQPMLDALMRINLLGGALLKQEDIFRIVDLWYFKSPNRRVELSGASKHVSSTGTATASMESD
jgi:hypothetical protein